MSNCCKRRQQQEKILLNPGVHLLVLLCTLSKGHQHLSTPVSRDKRSHFEEKEEIKLTGMLLCVWGGEVLCLCYTDPEGQCGNRVDMIKISAWQPSYMMHLACLRLEIFLEKGFFFTSMHFPEFRVLIKER